MTYQTSLFGGQGLLVREDRNFFPLPLPPPFPSIFASDTGARWRVKIYSPHRLSMSSKLSQFPFLCYESPYNLNSTYNKYSWNLISALTSVVLYFSRF